MDPNQDLFIYFLSELIIILEISSNYILKVLKPLYSVLKTDNHWFATYQNYHINYLFIIESNSNSCLLYRYDLLGIVDLQTNDTLMLANNTFTTIDEKAIKMVKFITNKRDYFFI